MSSDLLKKKLSRYPHLSELESFVNQIDKKFLKLILLYGSLAKGTYTQFSDIDILCVFDKEFKDQKERFLAAYKYSNGIVQSKTLSYKEFKEAIQKGNPFLYSILKDAIILYSKIPEDVLADWINKGKENLTVKYFSP